MKHGPAALFAIASLFACSGPERSAAVMDGGQPDVVDGDAAARVAARAPLAYVPAGCAHTVRSTSGAVFNRMGDESTVGADPAPRAVHVNFAADPRSTAAVLWRTDDGTLASVIEYGTDPSRLDRRAVGHVSRAGFGVPVTVHEVHLCGLAPDTTYYYRVGAIGAFSEVQSFETAPADGDGAVNFAFFGDSRDDFTVLRRVNEALVRQSGTRVPDAVLFTGDAVPSGLVQDDWDRWFAASSATLRAMPYIMAHGNHEGLAANYLHQFAQPQSEDRAQSELFWSWDFGPVHLVVLNDSPFPFTEGVERVQRDWLARDLASANGNRANVPWVVVMHHKGPFSSATHTDDLDVAALRRAWVPLYAQHQVDLVVNGHDHHFELTHPLDAAGDRAPDGTYGVVYATAGASGADLYNAAPRFWTRTLRSTVHFATLRVARDSLRIEAFAVDLAGMSSPIAGSCVQRARDPQGQRPVDRPCE